MLWFHVKEGGGGVGGEKGQVLGFCYVMVLLGGGDRRRFSFFLLFESKQQQQQKGKNNY